MKIAFSSKSNLSVNSKNKDIIFDLVGKAIYARGVKYQADLNESINYSPTSQNLSEQWIPSGLKLTTSNGFSNGLFIIKIQCGSLIFSGTASVYVGEITTDDEIMLHMCGIPQKFADGTQGRIYAKIAPSADKKCGELYLATNIPQDSITNLSIAMKKLL